MERDGIEAPMEETQGSVSAEISTAAVQLVAEYTGRGPTKARTVINQDSVMILMGDTLTKGERSLANKGMSEHVLETRRRYQDVMQDDLSAAVEKATGRKVIAFMSANHIDPDLAAEVMVLEPVSEDGDGAAIGRDQAQ
jgi:uncharacterized protein YbcI